MGNTISRKTKSESISAESYTSVAKTAVLSLLLGFTLTSQAADTVCGPDIKEEIAIALSELAETARSDSERLAMEAKLYEQYAYCAEDITDDPIPVDVGQIQLAAASNNFYIAAAECGATVSNLGSLFYEQMSCCGYDPQRRMFACPVTIKQGFGFGPAPLPGSREYVLNCVANNNNVLVPVAVDSVHLANAMTGNPPWQFAVIASANQNLHTVYPMDGQTRRARSILSWGFQPTSCNFRPIWGNALNYNIRRDQ